MSLSVRPNEVRFSGGFIRCRVMAFGRENSRSPSAPWIRPNPDSPTPPNGRAGTIANPITEFTEVIPVRSDRAAAIAAARSRENTADPSPYRPALANDTPSARFATGVTVTVGPNVSSVTAAEYSGTSVSTTGRTYGGATASGPPTADLPPRASASATCLATISGCDGSVIGPYEASPSKPGRSSLTLDVSRSMKLWYTASATYTRSIPMQVCPALDIAPQAAASAAASRSASAATSRASLPPHSASTGVRVSAAAAMTLRAVAAEPVKAILATPLRASSSPVEPPPVISWSTGLTSPNCSRAEANERTSQFPVAGVSSDGLNTTAFPAASA